MTISVSLEVTSNEVETVSEVLSGSEKRSRMAHKKAGGSTSLGRDSIAKRLGVKIFGGQKVYVGNIIIKQRGTKYHPGKNTQLGKDYTIFALKEGRVEFRKKKLRGFHGNLKNKTIVNVV